MTTMVAITGSDKRATQPAVPRGILNGLCTSGFDTRSFTNDAYSIKREMA
eukprot:CAMPEP_0178805792 /NCGR_PEP_ID=MMETSP0745-20121128/15942_1 /TAXON_ID=913974 /ORGANISM="Nitzschia punctata, Strain CCMP561" /LENGTH=49 /DNA_ID=CAMNT_0020465463 /DNA_START=90 /DNA_END=239 /DNA_ORIENTATION=+